jgi:hypothetical protein
MLAANLRFVAALYPLSKTTAAAPLGGTIMVGRAAIPCQWNMTLQLLHVLLLLLLLMQRWMFQCSHM